MTENTFTERELVEATFRHHRGCISGKVEFLRDQFNIDPYGTLYPITEYDVTINCRIRFDARHLDSDSYFLDEENELRSAEEIISQCFQDENLHDNVSGITMLWSYDVSVDALEPVQTVLPIEGAA